MNPFRTLHEAIRLPFTAVWVTALCYAINAWTGPGNWWAHWVAFGMGIAVLCAWLRALRLLLTAGLLAAIAAWLLRQVDSRRGARFTPIPAASNDLRPR